MSGNDGVGLLSWRRRRIVGGKLFMNYRSSKAVRASADKSGSALDNRYNRSSKSQSKSEGSSSGRNLRWSNAE